MIAVPSMAMYSSRYLRSRTLCNRSLWLFAHANELSPRPGLCLWGWHGARTVLLFWKLEFVNCSSPACPSRCASLATAGRGSLSLCSVAGPRAAWKTRQAGHRGCQAVVCSKGELSPRPGLGGGTSMVRTVQVSHTHSPFSSLGTWLPGFWSAHEVGVHPAGGGCHFSCDPKGWEKARLPTMPPSGWAEVGAGALRCRGTKLGAYRRYTLLLAHPAAVRRAWAPRPCDTVEAAHPQPGRSLRLHPCRALLYTCLPTALLGLSKIKILTSYKIY